MQLELKKKETFADGIKSLLLLRSELFKIVESFFAELGAEDFSKMPFSRHLIMHVEACEKIKGKLHLKK